tara:strand:+ start:1259 stop:1711 length:453 start_codon:yes stop_codon:yes gene_type:complete
MALNVDTSKIDDEKVWFEVSQETLDKEKKKNSKRPIIGNTRRISDEGKTYQMKAEVNMIILLTMNIGMNEITEKNYNKFYNRIHLLENMIERDDMQIGAFLSIIKKVGNKEVLKPSPYTKEMIKDLIGLKTNSTILTKSQFLKRVLRMEL